ncbi:MAG: glycoside hydrolase family 108 protein [Shewanella sp.]
MASFEPAYNQYIKPSEGGYSHVVQDKGGETYAGIARNYFPNWKGWTYIDFIKRTKGPISRNTLFPDIQFEVEQFYRDWWTTRRFGEIKSQELANLLFDYNVNSGTLAIKAVQRLVGVPTDGALGPATLAAINKADAAKLHDALKEERRQLYLRLIDNDPSQEVFRAGWMNRLSKFPSLVVSSPISWVVIVAVGLLLTGYYLYQQKAMS